MGVRPPRAILVESDTVDLAFLGAHKVELQNRIGRDRVGLLGLTPAVALHVQCRTIVFDGAMGVGS